MLYLVTGYFTEHREGDPTVLYCGYAAEAAESAVAHAKPDFLRVEKAMVPESYKVRSGVVAGVAAAPVIPSEVEGPRETSGDAAPPSASAVVPDSPASPAPLVVVPSLREVMDAGYDKDAAKRIVARQKLMRDAQEKDSTLTQAALEAIADKYL